MMIDLSNDFKEGFSRILFGEAADGAALLTRFGEQTVGKWR